MQAGAAAALLLSPCEALANEFDILNEPTPTKNYVIDDANVLNKTTKKSVNDQLSRLEVSLPQIVCRVSYLWQLKRIQSCCYIILLNCKHHEPVMLPLCIRGMIQFMLDFGLTVTSAYCTKDGQGSVCRAASNKACWRLSGDGVVCPAQTETGYRLEAVTVRKLEFENDAFAFGDKVIEKWYPTVEIGGNKGILVVVTSGKDGALTGGPAFNKVSLYSVLCFAISLEQRLLAALPGNFQ